MRSPRSNRPETHGSREVATGSDRWDLLASSTVPEGRPHDATTAGAATGAPVVLVGDQAAMPAEDGVGGDDGADLGEQPAAEGLATHRETPPLIVAEPQPPAAELLAEHPVRFAQILDRSLLAIAEPPGEDRGEELKGWVHRARVPMARTIAVPAATLPCG